MMGSSVQLFVVPVPVFFVLDLFVDSPTSPTRHVFD